MDEYVELAAAEVPEGRAFTHPDRTQEDLAAIREMAAALRRVLAAPLPERPRPLVLDAARPGALQHRVVLCDERRLRASRAPELVGFFAERRPELDHTPLTTTDDELILEFPAHPGILSYSSLELADGNWGNLIVIDHDGGFATVYAHNQVNLVTRGERVSKGQVIAKVGMTGIAETPYVHFEIRQNAKAKDPLAFLQ